MINTKRLVSPTQKNETSISREVELRNADPTDSTVVLIIVNMN